MLKKVIILCLICTSFLVAKEFKNHEAEYEIRYGVLGEVGKGTAIFTVDKNHYKIEIKAQTAGLAKLLSKGRKDWMVSEGSIVDGKMLPRYFKKVISTVYKTKSKHYTFYHDKKKIVMHQRLVKRVKKLTSMDIVMGKKKKDIAFKESVSEKTQTLPFFVADDILSLFTNLKIYLGGDFEEIAPTKLFALGGDKKDGSIEVYTPQDQAIEEELGSDGHILVVLINQAIFSSEKGELFIKVNDDGIALNAILKDVVLFGDVGMKLKKLKIY